MSGFGPAELLIIVTVLVVIAALIAAIAVVVVFLVRRREAAGRSEPVVEPEGRPTKVRGRPGARRGSD